MIQPRRLTAYPRLAAVATGSAVDPRRLRRGLVHLTAAGFRLVHSNARRNTQSEREAADNQRVKELHRALADPAVDIIMAARGGYGTLRILDQVDYDLVRSARKLMIGYSDFTALNLAIYARTRLVTFSGPMVTVDFTKTLNQFALDSMLSTLRGNISYLDLKSLGGRILSPGRTRGTLLGGNLSVLTRLIGTRYFPRDREILLFLEDVDESPGRIDNMLAQLRLSGSLGAVKGVLIGRFTKCRANARASARLISGYFQRARVPIVAGLPFGHVRRTLTLPVGVPAEVDTQTLTLRYLKCPVA